jgi:acetyl-CoA C-acetyltransferase
MRQVAVIGIGQTKIDEHWDKSLRELAGEAIMAAFEDADITHFDALYLGNMLSATANSQQQIGAYIADWLGLRGSEAIHIESACSSGAAAFRSAVLAVASGDVGIAVAAGVEKMTDIPSSEITLHLATAADADWEVDQGVSFVALNALIMQRYMHEYGWNHSDFANFSINAHANAKNNPFARFHSSLTFDQYKNSPMICDPINIMDASPIGDGAAAAILVPLDPSQISGNGKTIRIAASSAASDTISIHSRKDPLWLRAAEMSANDCYRQAGLAPRDIDVFEYHDAFTIMAALSLEASGFCRRGEAPRMALENRLSLSSPVSVATMGGLKARGHPVGATGMYQLVETIQQLRGEAGDNQKEKAVYAMAQNIGGSGSNIITHILSNVI